MIIKKRAYHELERLSALRHRTSLTADEQTMLQTLIEQKELEDYLETFITSELTARTDLIWHYTYADYHQDVEVNLIVIEADTIHVFKANQYRGLHTLNRQGMLTEFFTGTVRDDLARLMGIKLGLQYLLGRSLSIETRAICLSCDFELDVHSDHILTAETLPHYFSQMTAPSPHMTSYREQLTAPSAAAVNQPTAVQNGLRCPHCEQLADFNYHHHLILCLKCRQISTLDQAFVSAAEEYFALFPGNRLTKDIMYRWCNRKIPAAKVASLLKKHFNAAGKTKGTYYLREKESL